MMPRAAGFPTRNKLGTERKSKGYANDETHLHFTISQLSTERNIPKAQDKNRETKPSPAPRPFRLHPSATAQHRKKNKIIRLWFHRLKGYSFLFDSGECMHRADWAIARVPSYRSRLWLAAVSRGLPQDNASHSQRRPRLSPESLTVWEA